MTMSSSLQVVPTASKDSQCERAKDEEMRDEEDFFFFDFDDATAYWYCTDRWYGT